MNNKRNTRLRRLTKTREHIKRLASEKQTVRLSINRSIQHIYAQVVAPEGGKILATASSLEKSVRDKAKSTNKRDLAAEVGKLIAERAIKAGVKQVASDRSGFKYHGRIAALIESARENGLVV